MSEAHVKTVHLIVHGQKKLLEQVKEKLVAKGFQRSSMQQQVLKGVEIKEITGTRASESQNNGIDAWTSISQKELY
jgi:ketopantoate reductase